MKPKTEKGKTGSRKNDASRAGKTPTVPKNKKERKENLFNEDDFEPETHKKSDSRKKKTNEEDDFYLDDLFDELGFLNDDYESDYDEEEW